MFVGVFVCLFYDSNEYSYIGDCQLSPILGCRDAHYPDMRITFMSKTEGDEKTCEIV